MIDELYVKDIALIREARLYPSAGLTAITGETGAGKTALLSALKLLAGERGDASMVREGASGLAVQARLFPRDAQGAGADESGVVVERTVSADGRSRVHLDGAIAPVGKLAQDVGTTIDLCGQHEHQHLLKSVNHLGMLDAWIGQAVQQPLQEYRDALRAMEDAQTEVDRIEDVQRMGEGQVDQARYVLDHIDGAHVVPGEYEELCATVQKAENAEALVMGAEGVCSALSGDGGVLDALGSAMGYLDAVCTVDAGLAPVAQSLQEAGYIVEDVARDVRRYRDSLDFDLGALSDMQERMAQLQGLLRTWGPTMDQVLAARDEAASTVAAVENSEGQMAAAREHLAQAREALQKAGDALHALRAQAAPQFAHEVTAQMARLDLQDASLECSVEKRDLDQWGRSGPSKVEFMFKSGRAISARPLAKIASGGEISRVMLAIKVVLGGSDQVQTLVFDEVDAGVGGAAARSLAEVIVDLASTHQVIVVTHLAQIAAPAQVHYVVSKTAGEDPRTVLEAVSGEERVAEIARMLSGDDSPESLAHARQLLKSAAR